MKNQVLNLLVLVTITLAMSACETHEMAEPGRLVPLTVTEDPTLPSITVNGTVLHSEAFGDPNDPLIVVIHGGPGSDYRSMLSHRDLVNDGYYVAFYDQRGSGLSQRHDDRGIFTTQIFIDDLDAVIDYYSSPDQQVILSTHSWGSMLAAGYVNQHPDKVDAMILMEPGGLTWPDTEDYLEKSVPIKLFTETINDALYMDQIITSSEHEVLDYKHMLLASADFADDNAQGNAGPIPLWRSGAICSTALTDYVVDNPFDFTTNLGQYETRVLFAYSELNEAYPRSWAEHVSSPFPNVELFEVQGSGHEIPTFGWEKMYPRIINYLNTMNQQ